MHNDDDVQQNKNSKPNPCSISTVVIKHIRHLKNLWLMFATFLKGYSTTTLLLVFLKVMMAAMGCNVV